MNAVGPLRFGCNGAQPTDVQGTPLPPDESGQFWLDFSS